MSKSSKMSHFFCDILYFDFLVVECLVVIVKRTQATKRSEKC